MNTRLLLMKANGLIPNRGGCWIDCYNQSVNEDIAGTILAGINSKNHYFVTRDMSEQLVLGWTRDKKGKITNIHEVTIANAVTSRKRDNSQDYVIRQRGHGYKGESTYIDISPTITGKAWHCNNVLVSEQRISKLTERECFRLMDVDDETIDKIQAAGISRTAQYHLAGNSICVGVLYHVFDRLFIHTEPTDRQLSLF